MIASGHRSHFGLVARLMMASIAFGLGSSFCYLGPIFHWVDLKSFSGVIRGLAAVLACSTCVPAKSAEYCLRPNKREMQTGSIVCCSTPAGWQGWKDNPNSQQRIKQFGDAHSRGGLARWSCSTKPI